MSLSNTDLDSVGYCGIISLRRKTFCGLLRIMLSHVTIVRVKQKTMTTTSLCKFVAVSPNCCEATKEVQQYTSVLIRSYSKVLPTINSNVISRRSYLWHKRPHELYWYYLYSTMSKCGIILKYWILNLLIRIPFSSTHQIIVLILNIEINLIITSYTGVVLRIGKLLL